ncbi:MAG: type I glyceraldehyde-3-phosphate dehydrogenase [candidate division Zixibacteria bacterium]|nr:type I glyceraldehyde-3-phosphate dehydrogenase [candidate division Zixibacteria bacterium]
MKVAVNGFGRIGRLVFKAARGTNLEFVAINDLTDAKTLAYLLKYDSIHGRFPGEVTYRDNDLIVDGRKIPVTAEKDPSKLPWKAHGVDVVLECTGIFRSKEQAMMHIKAGARKVLISAPAKGHDGTFIPGINADQYDKARHDVISIGSCTTNCLAPMAKVLMDNFGIVKGFMTTIHAYTNDQQILDFPHKDLRRARAAAVSMIPTTTGAAKAISEVIPKLKGRMDGCAIRVPISDASLVDLAVILEKETTADEINAAMKKAASSKPMSITLEYCEDPIVSIDVIGNPHGCVFDSLLTSTQGNLAKVFAWYDNEWGFSVRMVDMIEMML